MFSNFLQFGFVKKVFNILFRHRITSILDLKIEILTTSHP